MSRLAFTTRHSGHARVLENKIGISEPYDPKSGGEVPDIHEFNAVWDTGATHSVIAFSVIKRLGLTKINEMGNSTANGMRMASVYLANIYLPNKVAIFGIEVIDGDIHGADALIGMDIIGHGDFAITHKSNKTTLSFQIPSSHDIDFVKEIETQKVRKGFRQPEKKKNNRKKRK